jgi:hypothetical protein
MSAWILLQIILDLFLAVGLFIIFKKISKNPKDDPRLSRGLQLLQSKIAILEDLSDRTEVQVGQLTAMIDQKAREVQAKIQAADKQIQAIQGSMEKSLEVAKIFQDKIPHEEIIERQNSMKYIQAARMAHKGLSVDQIREEVDLPDGELDFIVKINRNQLMFAEEELPAWAKDENGAKVAAPAAPVEKPAAAITSPADNPEETLEQLGEKFRRVQIPAMGKVEGGVSIRKAEFPRIEK